MTVLEPKSAAGGAADVSDLLRRRVAELEELTIELHGALEAREVIGQAKGILVEREGCSPDQAFQRLMRVAEQTDRKVHEVAAGLVARTVARRYLANGGGADRT